MKIMPFPGGSHEIYMLGPLKSASATVQLGQLGSHISQYIPDSQVGNGRSPFPLRTTGEKSPTIPNPPLLTQSILSGRRSSHGERYSIERLDSLEDTSSSGGDSDDVDSPPLIRLRDPPQGTHGRRSRRHNVPYQPILRRFSFDKAVKKSVKFADDLGFDLARTHLFDYDDDDYNSWEPDPEPRADYYRSPSRKSSDLVVEISEWQVNFSQPAADYLGFRERLEAHNVALENVIIKQKCNSFMGTIKVKNISFRKDVFVRCSFNSWETFSDFPAKYCVKAADVNDIYDTFSFEIAIPEEAVERHVVEFCIGFRTDGKECWDSNQGKNFQVITSQMKHRRATEKHQDAYKIETPKGSWGEFASWTQLDNHQPYW